MSRPFFSVIVPVYNTAPYLRECLDSIFNQGCPDTEVIAVNDGSTDNSAEILFEYARRHPCLVTIHQDNGGVAMARNRGMDWARGRYFLFIDSDDSFLPDALGKLRAILDAGAYDFVEFDSVSFDSRTPASQRKIEKPQRGKCRGRDEGTGQELFADWVPAFFFRTGPCCRAYSADFLRKAGLRFRDNLLFEDNEWTPRVFRFAQQARYIPEILYRRRMFRPGSLMENCRKKFDPQGCSDLFFIVDFLCTLSCEKGITVPFSAALRQRASSVFLHSCYFIWTLADSEQRRAFAGDIRNRWHLTELSPNWAWRLLSRLSALIGIEGIRRIYRFRHWFRRISRSGR